MNINSAQIKRRQNQDHEYLGKVGKVISFTSIAVGPQGLHTHTPYLVALVRFGKKQITLPLIELEAPQVKIGMEVVGVLRRMREPEPSQVIVYGVKCLPAEREISNKEQVKSKI